MRIEKQKLPVHGKFILLISLGILTNLLTLSTTFAEASKDAKLLFLGNKNIPPVVYLDNSATPSGIVVDIVQALSKHMPQPIEVKAMDWKEAQELVARGEADALIQINPTNERLQIYDFSDTLLESRFSIFTTANRIGIAGITSLRGLRVGVEAGGLPRLILGKDPQIQIEIIPNFPAGFELLSKGVIDAVVVDYRVGAYYLAEHKKRNIKVTGEPIAVSYSAIAVKKGDTELLAAINKAMQIIKADGTYRDIINKWEPKEVVFQTKAQVAQTAYTAIILILLILFIIAAAWLVTLRKQLIKRTAVEEKLMEQYATLCGIVNSVDSPIYSVDRQYRYTSFNQEHAATMRMHYGAEIRLGGDMLACRTVPEDRETAERNISLALGGEHVVEEAYSGPAGSRRYFRMSYSPIRNEEEIIGATVLAHDITERKLMEDQLKLSEERFAKVFQLIPDTVTIARADGTIVAVNDAWAGKTGYSREEIIGKTAVELGIWPDPKDRERIVDVLKRHGQVRDLLVRFRQKDGNFITCNTAARLININGENCTMLIVRDVTEQLRDKACEDILRQISMQILAEIPLNIVLDYACEQLVSVFDLSLAWVSRIIPGTSLRADAAAGVLAESFAQVASCWGDEADRAFPEILVSRTGRKLVLQTKDKFAGLQNARVSHLNIDWAEVGSCAIFPLLVQGEPIAGLGLVSRWEHYWDERMLSRLESFVAQVAVAVAAAENRQKLILQRTCLETVNSAIAICDKNAVIEWVNPAFLEMSGYDYPELIGKSMSELRFNIADAEYSSEESFQQMHEKNMAEGGWHGELTAWRKDGSSFPAEVIVTASKNEHGEIVNTVSVTYDITERKQAIEAVMAAKEARARAEKLFSLGALTAGISHELNQPLNSIKMIASGISYAYKKGRNRDVAEIIPQIEEISRQTDRINSIVNQLRALTRRNDISNNSCSLNAAVKQSLSIISQQMKTPGIEFETHLAEGLPQILANITSLEQIIINLVVNAVQALNTVDKSAKQIVIRTYFDGGVILSVSDNGPGIPAEVGRKVFDPFVSSKLDGDNMGLGLAIVNSLVTSYKGTIDFESDGQTGVIFIVRFPAAN